jgi:hypothetical protein
MSVGKYEETDDLKDKGIEERIILKWNSSILRTELVWLRIGLMAGSCEHGN